MTFDFSSKAESLNLSFEAGSLMFANAEGEAELIQVFLIYNPAQNKLVSLIFSKKRIGSIVRITKTLRLIKIIYPEITNNDTFYINRKEYTFFSDPRSAYKDVNYIGLVSNSLQTIGIFKFLINLVYDGQPFVKETDASSIMRRFNSSSLSDNLAVSKDLAILFLLVDCDEEKSRLDKAFETPSYRRKKLIFFDFLTWLQGMQNEQKNLPVENRDISLMESLYYSFLLQESKFEEHDE